MKAGTACQVGCEQKRMIRQQLEQKAQSKEKGLLVVSEHALRVIDSISLI